MTRVFPILVAALLFSSGAAGQGVGGVIQRPPGPPPPPGIQPPSRDAAARTGTARIRGHVFSADTGQPLRKAQVRAMSPELREMRIATSDEQGAYEFKELPAGRYNLTASKGSYVSLNYGQVRPFDSGKPLEILDAQTVEKVDFTLPRGAVITGRIVDEFGDPVADAQVMAMRYQFMQGRRQLVPSMRPATTNDIGEYRIFGLPPGQFYLSATLRNMMMGATSDDRSGYAPTYFPGTPNVAEAQRVNVTVASVVSDVNMTLIPTRTSKVSGVALDGDGKPLAGGFVNVIQRTGTFGMGMSGGQVRPDGTFSISGLAPGEYTLFAQIPGGVLDVPEAASAQITVSGDDISGVQLIAVKPVLVTGRIVVDPAQANAFRPTAIRLMAQPAQPEAFMPMGITNGKVNDDLTFELRVRPGRMVIRLTPFGIGVGDWTLKAVRLNGADVTDTGAEFRPNEDVSGVDVEVTNQVSQVSGIVTNARGESLKDYTVIVFARDEQQWAGQTRYIGTGRPDQEGRFKVRALPAGDYYAVAVDYVEPGTSTDPELLARLRDRAVTFSLNDGETKTLDLKLQAGT